MPEIKENFFENILFRFESCSCECVEDIEHTAPGVEPTRKYKLLAIPDRKIVFAYAAKKGLVRIAPNGTIEGQNILGGLISLPNKPISALSHFLEKNGFLFPISSLNYEEFDADVVYYIINRLKLTVELMTAANEIHKDYQKILMLTLQLLMAGDVKIKTASMEKEYVPCHHPYLDCLNNANFSISSSRQQECFDSNFYTVEDSLVGTYKLGVDFYNDICGGYSTTPGYSDQLFRKVVALYLNYDGSAIERKITDFLFHYLYEVGIPDFNSGGLQFYAPPRTENFTAEMKSALIEIARYVIGEEINANLGGIHPVYNPVTMSPSWKVDSLLCAAYFSVFYLKPDLELYRPCDNPKCGKYFLVKTTSTKVRYCSTECCNRVTQARYRKRRREREDQQ